MARLAVVLSGGGSKGAFQVGALDELRTKGVDFDIWVGTSTGAIQAAAGATNALEGLLAIWHDELRGNSDVYLPRMTSFRGWMRIIWESLASRRPLQLDCLYDTAPIRKKMRRFFADAHIPNGKELRIGVASLQSGERECIRESDGNLADWVYASCAEPVFFEPHWAILREGKDHHQWVDGGVRDITPIGLAMEAKPDRVLVINTNSRHDFQALPGRRKNILEIALRTVGILTSEVLRNDIDYAERVNRLLKTRDEMRASGVAEHLLAPLEEMLDGKAIVPIVTIEPEQTVSQSHAFDQAKIRAGIEAGRKAVRDHWTAGKNLKAFLSRDGGQEHGNDQRLVTSRVD